MLKARSLAGLAISALLLVLFLRSVDVWAMVASITGVNPLFLLPGVAIYFVGVWLRAARWNRLLAPFAAVPVARLFCVIIIGFAVNNLLPFRLGELVRTFLLRNSNSVPIAASLASILLERVLDVVVLCGLMVAVSLLAPLSGWPAALASFSWLVVGCAAAGLAVLLLAPRTLLRWALDQAVRLAERLSARLGRLVGSFLGGIRAVETPRSMLLVGGVSIACWTAELGLYYFVMLAFGFNSGPLSLIAGMVAANLATVVPSSPGYVGTFDLPLQSVLADTFGVATATASSYTLVAHALLLLPVVLLGLVLLGREDLSLRALGQGRVELRSAARPRAPSTQALPD